MGSEEMQEEDKCRAEEKLKNLQHDIACDNTYGTSVQDVDATSGFNESQGFVNDESMVIPAASTQSSCQSPKKQNSSIAQRLRRHEKATAAISQIKPV